MSEHVAASSPDHASPEHGTHDSDAHHGADMKTYMMVFVALCVLTGASFFTYSSYWPFGVHAAWAFMMAVSCTKAMLVILFFMHMLYEANWKYVVTIPTIFMAIFLMLMLIPDIGMRMNRASPERKRYMAIPAAEEHVEHESASPAPAPH